MTSALVQQTNPRYKSRQCPPTWLPNATTSTHHNLSSPPYAYYRTLHDYLIKLHPKGPDKTTEKGKGQNQNPNINNDKPLLHSPQSQRNRVAKQDHTAHYPNYHHSIPSSEQDQNHPPTKSSNNEPYTPLILSPALSAPFAPFAPALAFLAVVILHTQDHARVLKERRRRWQS